MAILGRFSDSILPYIQCSRRSLEIYNTIETFRLKPETKHMGLDRCIYDASQYLDISNGNAKSTYKQVVKALSQIPSLELARHLLDQQEECSVPGESVGVGQAKASTARVDTRTMTVEGFTVSKTTDSELLQEYLMKAIEVAGRIIERGQDAVESKRLNALLTEAEDTIENALKAINSFDLKEGQAILQRYVNKQVQRVVK